MNDKEAKVQLLHIRQWAQDKIASGSEPPWAWYQYMKLIETADAILKGMTVRLLDKSEIQMPL